MPPPMPILKLVVAPLVTTVCKVSDSVRDIDDHVGATPAPWEVNTYPEVPGAKAESVPAAEK